MARHPGPQRSDAVRTMVAGMDANTLLTSAAVAGAVSVLGAAVNQSRQSRREREETMRARMIEAADDIAVVSVRAAELLFRSFPAVRAHRAAVAGDDPQGRDEQARRDVDTALEAAGPLVDDAKAKHQRIALLFGPHSESDTRSDRMVMALHDFKHAFELEVARWDETRGWDHPYDEPLLGQFESAIRRFAHERREFVEAVHDALRKPLDSPDRTRVAFAREEQPREPSNSDE